MRYSPTWGDLALLLASSTEKKERDLKREGMHNSEEENRSLFSFHLRPLALLSCQIVSVPANPRPTSELFFYGCHKLATVRLHGYCHLNLCPRPLQSLTHFCLHTLPSPSQGCAPIRLGGNSAKDGRSFTGF